MFTDADYPLLPYPGARPPFSFVHEDGGGLPVTPDRAALSGWRVGSIDLDAWLADRGAEPMAQRVPLFSYGSNACPGKLTWLRATSGLSGPVVVLRAVSTGVAAVWAAGLRVVDGQRPAVLAASPGTVEEHAVVMVTPKQVQAFDSCEARGDRHHLARVLTGKVVVDGGTVLEDVPAYVGRTDIRRPLLVNDAPVRCADVRQIDTAGLSGAPAAADGLRTHVLTGPPDPDDFPGLLFVYGTLQPGARAWHLLAPLSAGAPVPARLPAELFDTGQGYPALRLGGDAEVSGWLVRFTAGALTTLDEYEGGEYTRVRVTMADGTQCWTYVWTGPTENLTVLRDPWPSSAPMG
ncbi:MAG: gamma-glutamylcyclotransferase [Actinomycetota bacterium]|nr:gamma-glutamylcyclotransferase [Actinomycetota bacterium]